MLIWSAFGCARRVTDAPPPLPTHRRSPPATIQWSQHSDGRTTAIRFARPGSNSPIADIRVPHWGVRSVAFNTKATRALIAQSDGEVLLVDIAQSAVIARCGGESSGILEATWFADDDNLAIARTQDGAFWTWRVFPDAQKLVSHAKSILPRCLTPQQRRRFSLAPEPPTWCAGKWQG